MTANVSPAGTVCTCVFSTVAPVLLLDLPFFLPWGLWPMSRTHTSPMWQSQVGSISVIRNDIENVNNDHIIYVRVLHFRPRLGLHCVSSCGFHDASSSAVGSFLLHHDHLTGARQSGDTKIRWWNQHILASRCDVLHDVVRYESRFANNTV